jgi:hypothetical protein
VLRQPTHPWYDRLEGNLVVLRFPRTASVDEVESFYRYELEWLSQLDEHVVWLTDIDRVDVGARHRQAAADGERAIREYLRARVVAIGIVAGSPLVRGILTAVHWIESPPSPYRIFGDEQEARAWLNERWTEHLRAVQPIAPSVRASARSQPTRPSVEPPRVTEPPALSEAPGPSRTRSS